MVDVAEGAPARQTGSQGEEPGGDDAAPGAARPFCQRGGDEEGEDHFEDGLSTSEGVDLIIRGLHASMRRESASGDGMNKAIITNKDFKPLTDDDIQKRISKMKLS